jgi:hypothetical protein
MGWENGRAFGPNTPPTIAPVGDEHMGWENSRAFGPKKEPAGLGVFHAVPHVRKLRPEGPVCSLTIEF